MNIIQNFKNATLTARILSLTILPLVVAGIIYLLLDPRIFVVIIVGCFFIVSFFVPLFLAELIAYTFFGHIADGAIFFKKKRV